MQWITKDINDIAIELSKYFLTNMIRQEINFFFNALNNKI